MGTSLSFKDIQNASSSTVNLREKGTTIVNNYVAGKIRPAVDAVDKAKQTANNLAGSAAALVRKTDNDILKNVNYGNEGRSVPVKKELLETVEPGYSGTPEADDTKFGYKVRLFAVRDFPSGERVVFDVSPTLSESRTVEYNQVAPVHMPGSIQIYKRTGSRTFSLGAKLISRNTSQATNNIQILQLLRGWCMPYFGIADRGSEGQLGSDATSMLGAPPDVLYLFAYSAGTGGDDRTGDPVNLKKVPVVITNLSFDYPEDVDYIATASGEPFPVKMDVKLDLLETHSPASYEEFSLMDFKLGKLAQF